MKTERPSVPSLSFDPETIVPFEKLFPARQPVEVEIGCGNGGFAAALAERFPAVNFLAIDKGERWMTKGRLRGHIKSCANLVFLRGYAWDIVAAYVPPAGVQAFHIYFPDPWPKRRHRKNRLLDAPFFSLIHERLLPGGIVHLATDHAEYFTEIRKAVAKTEALWPSRRESINKRLAHEDLRTNYENKFLAAGKSLYYLDLQRA